MRRLALGIAFWMSACATREACPPGDLTLPTGVPAFVVVRSDYGSSAIALLDADGEVLSPDFVDSGSRAPALVTALAGDLVVPSNPLGRGTIAWLGRLNVDVLTMVAHGDVTEIDTRGELVGAPHTGFSANP